MAYVVGTGIHFFFVFAWGVVFAWVWPYFARRGHEATLIAIFFAAYRLDRDACCDRAGLFEPPELP